MNQRFALCLALLLPAFAAAASDVRLSTGRSADPTAKTLAEIRASEKRRIPLEVAITAEESYDLSGPVEVSVRVTNLFDTPLLINRRLLVNHPRLPGEIFFTIIGPDGKRCEIQRLITPMSAHDEDFTVLPRGLSTERTVDLSDLYSLAKKGTYKVWVTYHNDLDKPMGDKLVWKGSVISEPVVIQLN